MVVKVLTRKGATVPAREDGMLYKFVVHIVLLFECKIWVVTGEMFKVLRDSIIRWPDGIMHPNGILPGEIRDIYHK